MYNVASSTVTLVSSFVNVGEFVALVLGAVVVGLIALMGLAFGYKYIGWYILGKDNDVYEDYPDKK